MLITYILLFLLLLISVYLIWLPLHKKRTVLIREHQLAIIVALIIAMGAIISPFIYLGAIIAWAYFYVLGYWVIYDITIEQVRGALEKAATATRTEYITADHGYVLNGNSKVKIYSAGQKIHLVWFRNSNKSKKVALTKTVTKKFIQNYLTN